MRSLSTASSPVALLTALVAVAPQLTSAFYLPGVAPTSYKQGDDVPLYVNSVKAVASSKDALLHSVMSYDYYHDRFHSSHLDDRTPSQDQIPHQMRNHGEDPQHWKVIDLRTESGDCQMDLRQWRSEVLLETLGEDVLPFSPRLSR